MKLTIQNNTITCPFCEWNCPVNPNSRMSRELLKDHILKQAKEEALAGFLGGEVVVNDKIKHLIFYRDNTTEPSSRVWKENAILSDLLLYLRGK